MNKIFSIVVTYNGMEWIQRCLSSLMESSVMQTIIVIDNDSTDQTVSFIQNHFPGVILHASEKNLGFGQANNIGLSMALSDKADYVFLLNQDAWVEKDTIKTCLDFYSSESHLGILSPIHLNGKGSALDRYFLSYIQKAGTDGNLEFDIINNENSNKIFEVDFVNAAAWMLSRKTIETIGGFNPLFFHYGEDANFAQRVRKMNMRILIFSNARIFHDREDRLNKVKPQQDITRDFTQFMVYAADVNRPSPLLFIIRNLASSFFHLIKDGIFLRSASVRYHLAMILKIISAANPILRSRKISTSKRSSPFL